MKNLGSGFFAWLTQSAVAAIICLVLVGISAPFSFAAMFPIATSGASQSYSFDGSNYLVGVENHLTAPSTIGAQMISATGAKIGSLIPTGRSGIATNVSFDGTNYLLIWEDDNGGSFNGSTGWQVWGQFINKAGAVVGSPFSITTTGIWFDGVKTMAFGGGKYMVTYTRLINPALGSSSNNRYIAGRIVDPNGTMGSEFRISTGFGAASDVAFDGTNFFVIWREDSADQEIRGRFVNAAGVLGTEISVNASAAASDNPKSVVFDGTNYLVVWNDEVGGLGSGAWDVFGQLVSPSAALVGGVITITSEPGQQMVTSVAFDGTNYLAVWMDMQNVTNWDMYGQFISKNGVLAGSKIPIATDAGNQMGGVGFVNGKYMVLVNSGVSMGEGGISQVDAAYGLFLYPPSQFTANGTYIFASGTLSVTTTNSSFLCNGPGFPAETDTVTSLTATTMVWQTSPTDFMTWTRAGGIAGDITGIWTSTDSGTGNTYTLTFNSNNTYTVSASVVQCSANGTPTISSFTPVSGMVGNLVTITGSNFSPIATNNTVQFNGVMAVVTGVRSSQLFALVPVGATTGTISVTNSDGTATSVSSFTVSAGTPSATFSWGGVHHRLDSDGSTFDALDAGINSYATTLSGMTLTVAGPNGFSYTFTDADIDPYINGQLALYKKYPTPATPLAAGVYTYTLNDGQGHISHRVDTHVTVAGPLPQVDTSTIQLQRTAANGSYRVSWAPVNDNSQTYYYRVRIVRNDTAETNVYDSSRAMIAYADVPAGVLFDDSIYKVLVETVDSSNNDLATNRSLTAWKLFSPQTGDYDANRLLTNFAIVDNRTNTNIDGSTTQIFEATLEVNNPSSVTTLITLTGPAGFTTTINPNSNISNRTTDGTTPIKMFYKTFTPISTGIYTFTYVANGITHKAYATLTSPVTYPAVEATTMQAQDLGTGFTRFSWANVNHTGALFYRVVLTNASGLQYMSARQNQAFVDISTTLLTSLVPTQWRAEVYDSSETTTVRNRFNTPNTSLTVSPYDAAAPVISSFRVRNMTNSSGAAYTSISVGATASQTTLTQILVTGPNGFSQNLLATGRYSPVYGAYTLEQPGTLSPGLYTITVTDTAAKSATRYMYVPTTVHPLPRPDYMVFHNDLASNGDMLISWAPVVSDIPVWYTFRVFNRNDLGDGLPNPVYNHLINGLNNFQQTSIVVPAATLATWPQFSMVVVSVADGSNSSVISNSSNSVIVGAENPGFNYATLVDADNDGYASDVDANDGDTTVYPFSTGNDGLTTAVTGTSPASNAPSVSTSLNAITVTFNKVIDQRTLGSSFTLDNGVTGAVTYNPATRTATRIPSAALLPGTMYTVTLTTALQDQAGHALVAPYQWSFTTAGSLPTLSVTITGIGNINSDTGNPGIHNNAVPGLFSSPYPWNSPVALTAAPGAGYDFSGWGGDGTCVGSSSPCNLNMNAQTKTVTATFTMQQNIKKGTNYYATIASAFVSSLLTNDTLQLKSMTFVENPVYNVPGVTVFIDGGYVDPGFTDNSGASIISGILTIQNGTVSVKKITIR